MVEQKEDKSSLYEKIIIEFFFNILGSLKSCFRLDIQEPLGLVWNLKYSLDNEKNGQEGIMERFDRVYMLSNLSHNINSQNFQYVIKGDGIENPTTIQYPLY